MSLKRTLVALCLLVASASSIAQIHVPDDLKDWQQWVLQDKEYRNCPFFFDRSLDQANAFVCSWPGELSLAVDGSGATTVDITEPDWKIIREGAVPEAAIRETLQSQEF